jgi:(2Fe-2S) ferredoxin
MTKEQYYQPHIFCCINKREDGHPTGCCASKGSVLLSSYMKTKMKAANIGQARVNSALCLGRCANGPVMVIYPEGIWYSYQSEADIDEIISQHLQRGQIVERLLIEATT